MININISFLSAYVTNEPAIHIYWVIMYIPSHIPTEITHLLLSLIPDQTGCVLQATLKQPLYLSRSLTNKQEHSRQTGCAMPPSASPRLPINTDIGWHTAYRSERSITSNGLSGARRYHHQHRSCPDCATDGEYGEINGVISIMVRKHKLTSGSITLLTD